VNAAETDYEARLALAEAELDRLVRRLRSLSPAAWRERRLPVVLGLARLAEVSARAEQRELPALPEIAEHALSDAAVVIGGDAVMALRTRQDDALLADVIGEIRGILDRTR
jgi:hypothetical protein